MISFSAVKIHQSIHKNIFPCRVHSSRFYTVNTLVKKYKTYGSLQSYNCHWNSPYTPLHTVQCCTLLLFIFQNVNILTDKSASHCHWSTFIIFLFNINNHFPLDLQISVSCHYDQCGHGIMGRRFPDGWLLRYRKWVPQQLGYVIVVTNSPPIGLMRSQLTNHHVGIVLAVRAWS